MLCENCKKREANVKYTQIINGVKKQMNLCSECSKELGLSEMDFNMPISFSSFFGDLLNEYNQSFMPLIGANESLQCDKCKMTYDEFVNLGKFGCDNCYNVFSEKIDPILKRIQGSNRYIGRKALNKKTDDKKIGIESNEKTSKDDKIKTLKQKINKLIKEENYEEAAKVRDEIKKLEQ